MESLSTASLHTVSVEQAVWGNAYSDYLYYIWDSYVCIRNSCGLLYKDVGVITSFISQKV